MEWIEYIGTFYSAEPQGCSEDEIAAVRKVFGVLPEMVEKFWRTAGRTKRLNCGQDNWVFPEAYSKWSWPGESEDLILLMENQGCCQAVVRREDLPMPDPPVYVIDSEGAKERAADTVSEFLEAALTYEAVWQMDFSAEEFYWLSSEDLTILQSRLTKRPPVLKKWFDMTVTFYSNKPDNLVVVMDVGDEYQCLFGAVSEESYLDIIDVMEGLGEPL